MKLLIAFMIFPFLVFSQFGNMDEKPILWNSTDHLSLPTQYLIPDKDKIQDLIQTEHASYIVASAIVTDIKFSDFVLSKILPNGDKLYNLQISSEGALGMRIRFENLEIDKNARIWIYDKEKTNFVGSYNSTEIHADMHLMSSVVTGNTVVIEYLEPKDAFTSNFQIRSVHHFFRGLKSSAGFKTSQSCMINMACPEGINYFPENFATCKILITGANFSGYCSGTLLNNTKEDGAPIILTANHCSEKSTEADLADWEYHFLYQSSTCNTPAVEPSFIRLKGSKALAFSGTDNGDKSSDFLLVRLNNALPTSYDFYFLGWNRSTSVPISGVCIHHADGDIKKISAYNLPATITSYAGNVQNTHFQVFWNNTATGKSVTQGGSSGAGLLNENKQLVGTLTGGASDCAAPDFLDPNKADHTKPDFYGRLNIHWNSYGTAANRRVDIHLDPLGLGTALSLRALKLSQTPAAIHGSNPSTNLLILSLENSILEASWNHINYALRVYNFIGQKIYQIDSEGKNTFVDFSGFPKGIYIIEATKGMHREVKKIVWQ